ncbi:uncharacterized protein [Drosophila kikkawai]|uniref:CCHC-type domain-containing protein n=1 Tax=Drosophila kikkawai TaxID=30033 RepID=A0ABM4GG91_DROKI
MEDEPMSPTPPPRSPTSEVGSAVPQSLSNDQLRALLEAQNKNFMDLLKSMQTNKMATQPNNKVTLPKFCPDNANADAAAWCKTVDIIMAENMLEGSALVMALSNSLEGGASQWLSHICYTGIKWPEFRELFLQQYEGVETPAASLLNMFSSGPKLNECVSVYASRQVTSLQSKWKNMSNEEIAVSVVLAHTAQIDKRLQHLLFTTNIKTRTELEQQLRAYSFGKRSDGNTPDHTGGPERKKQRSSWQGKCHYCGKSGHKVADCRIKNSGSGSDSKSNLTRSSTIPKRDMSVVTCFKCGQPGHIASKCTVTSSSTKGNTYEKRVDACTVVDPKGTLYQHEDQDCQHRVEHC